MHLRLSPTGGYSASMLNWAVTPCRILGGVALLACWLVGAAFLLIFWTATGRLDDPRG